MENNYFLKLFDLFDKLFIMCAQILNSITTFSLNNILVFIILKYNYY